MAKCLVCEKETKNKIFCSLKCYWKSDAVKKNFKENKYNWKGGRIKDRKGYINIRVYNHPFAHSRGYIMEHRLVMEKKLGRYLTKEEDVHHINGIKDDNRIENLELIEHGYHTTYEQKNGNPDRWARDYDACISCGRTDRYHDGKGLCCACRVREVYRKKTWFNYV